MQSKKKKNDEFFFCLNESKAELNRKTVLVCVNQRNCYFSSSLQIKTIDILKS